jgi:hypothetical protein
MKKISFMRIIYVLFVITGLSMWLNRPAYVSNAFPEHGLMIRSIYKPSNIYNLADVCFPLRRTSGYLLISGSIDMRSRYGQRQVFFQSNTDLRSLFLEYQPKNISINFGITDQYGDTQEINLGLLKKSGLFNFVFLINHDGTIKIFGNGVVDIPRQLRVESIDTHLTDARITCDHFRLNGSDRFLGTDGDVRVHISSGATYKDGLKLFEEYKSDYKNQLPDASYKWPLYAGILLWMIKVPNLIRKALAVLK